jgi:GT2 family glycosyltransferase
VVVTHRRPRLAGQVVRGLLDIEQLGAQQVVVVVNGEGGLDDPALEARVRMVRLADNLGPAGGFRAGLVERRGRKLTITGEARHGDTVVAEAEGLFITVDLSHFASGQQPSAT